MQVFDWISHALGLVSTKRLRETEREILDKLAMIEAKVNELSEQPELTVWDQVKRLAPLVTPGLTSMTAIAYFLGRMALQSYWGRLGLGLSQVSLSLEDYLFTTAEVFFILVSFGLGVPVCGLILILAFMRLFQSRPGFSKWIVALTLLVSSIGLFADAGSNLGWWSMPIPRPILGYIVFCNLVLGILLFIAAAWASQEKAVESEKVVSTVLLVAFILMVWITHGAYLSPISDKVSLSLGQFLLPIVSAGVLGVIYFYILKGAKLSLQVSVWGVAILVIMFVWWPAMGRKSADRILYPSDWPSSITVLTSEEPLKLPNECKRADNRYYTPVRDAMNGSNDTVIVIPIHEPISPTITLTSPIQIQIVPRAEILRMTILPQVTITSSQGLSTTMAALYGSCR